MTTSEIIKTYIKEGKLDFAKLQEDLGSDIAALLLEDRIVVNDEIALCLERLSGLSKDFWIKLSNEACGNIKNKETISINYGQFRSIKRDALDAFIHLASLPTSTYSYIERDVLKMAEQKIDSIVKTLLEVEENRND